MALLTVIIADSDKELLKRLCQLGIWSKSGFQLLGSFINLDEVMRFVKTRLPDLLIASYSMKDSNNLTFFDKLEKLSRKLYVILLIDEPDFKKAQNAMKIGAHFVMLKDELTENVLSGELERLSYIIQNEKNKTAILKRQVLRELVYGRKLD